MLIIKKPLSEQAAAKAKNPTLWRGWFSATVLEAVEKNDKNGEPMLALLLAVLHGGETREFRDWLTTSYDRSASKLRHACDAVGALAKYEAGEISQDDFAGRTCQVRLDIEKRRGFADRSVIVDYRRAVEDRVVTPLRAAG
jgi:hypothetical protein